MKKKVSILTVCICCLMVVTAFAQKEGKSKLFTGQVKFSMTIEGDVDPQKKANMPSEMLYRICGNKTKTTMNIGIPMHIVEDGDSCKLIRLLDIPGQQIAVVETKADLDEKHSNYEYRISKTGDTKVICGYECVGYNVITWSKEDEEEIGSSLCYTTTEIGSGTTINSASTPGLEGYILYSKVNTSEGYTIISEAVEVKKMKVNVAEFLIPSSYRVMSMEEFQALIGDSGEEDDF